MDKNANNDNSPDKSGMRIYIFKSNANGGDLRAFTDDLIGSKLPTQFAPWHTTGTIAPGNTLPHGFSRAPIEKAINDVGFQIWRLKPAKKD